MNWDSIFIIALGSSAGAIAGIVIGWLVSPLFGRKGSASRKAAAGILVIAGAICGYAFLPVQLEPLVQPKLDQFAGRSVPAQIEKEPIVTPEIPADVVEDAINRAMGGLNDPFLEAVLQREPGRAEQVRTRLASAYRRGGEDALLAALLETDQEILQVSFPYYMARATAADLLAAVEQIRVVITTLGRNDPMTCHAWLYGSLSGEPFDFDAYKAAVGADQHLELQTRLAAVVLGADNILPDYDEAYAMTVLDDVRMTLNGKLGDEKVGLIMAAQLPENTEDARLACEASGDYYDLILADPKAVDVFRHRYSGGNEFQ